MDIKSVKSVYFSPTGTTESVINSITDGLEFKDTELINLTKLSARKKSLKTTADQLLIVAVPVYMGRVPDLLNQWLNSIEADNTPAVCVVVYGNRVYEDALLELKDIVAKRGCLPIAGAAYIGEHSFSSVETPVAANRPDGNDLEHAFKFGSKVRAKLDSITSISTEDIVNVPGVRPYGGITKLWDVDFIAVSDLCSQCGICAQICPVGAINEKDSTSIDHIKCISCCACIKKCPLKARSIKPGPVQDASNRLTTLFSEPKQPENFI